MSDKKNDLIIRGKDGKLSSQENFLMLSYGENYVKEMLFMGTRGNGKTHGALLDFFISCVKFSNHSINGIFFRRRYNALEHGINTAEQICRSMFKECKKNGYYRVGGVKPEIRIYENGKIKSRLLFRVITNVKDYEDNYHGHEYQWICFDELSTWENMEPYNVMKSCLRYADPNGNTEELPLRMRATSNPDGIGLNSLINYFQKDKLGRDVKAGVIQEEKIMIGDGEFITNNKCWIFGSWVENYHLPRSYPVDLARAAKDNPAKLNAWLKGVPDFSETGMFCDLMIDSKILLEPFVIPQEWSNSCYMSYDDGTTSPFSVLWSVIAKNSQFVTINNREVFIPKGSVIVIDEIYGSDFYFEGITDHKLNSGDVDLSIGCRYVHSKIADLIIERNEGYIKNILNGRVAECGPADTSIKKNDRGGVNNTVYDIFKKAGLEWNDAYKGKGSRIDGAAVIRNMLKATVDRDMTQPHLYFVKGRTRFLVHNLKNLKRDPNNSDDILDENLDHDYDSLRYLLSFKNGRNTRTGFVRWR